MASVVSVMTPQFQNVTQYRDCQLASSLYHRLADRRISEAERENGVLLGWGRPIQM